MNVVCQRSRLAAMASAVPTLAVLVFAAAPSVAAVGSSSLLSRDLNMDIKERPVMKVVRMLQDMEAELKKELEDDGAVHEMLSCWCETNEKEKAKAIADGEATIAALKASIAEANAKVAELTEKRKATQDEQWADEKALGEATELRMKENKAFHAEEADLLEAIDACKQAVVALSKHFPELAQMKSIARRLRKARVAQLLQASNQLGKDQLKALSGFLQEAEGATSFLAIPGFKSYTPQSGQIFGILKQMKVDFEDSLSDAQKAEMKAVQEFEALRSAKEAQIAAAKKLIVEIDGQLAELMEKVAQETKELEATEYQLALDQEFLAKLRKKCAESEEEYQARVKSRLEEIAAVEDTVKILNTDEAFDVFDKTVNTESFDETVKQAGTVAAESGIGISFLQSAAGAEDDLRRQRAVALLQQAAGRTGSTQMAMLAATAQLDDFAKVKEAIDKLISELKTQQSDEITHKAWCVDEFDTNERETAAAEYKKESLLTKIAELEQTIKKLTEDIASAKSAVKEMQNQMKRASEVREAENVDYQQTVADQRLTQIILEKALSRMKIVYAFLQQQALRRAHQQPGAAHVWTSGNHTDPGVGPARFSKYEQNPNGKRVLFLLENVMADSRKMEDEAIHAEEDAQEAYEDFMKDSNKSITEHLKAIVDMEAALAKAKGELAMAKTDLAQTMQDLENLGQ